MRLGAALKFRSVVFIRHLGQSTAACLTAMTKGNLGAITPDHWKVALTTGAGVAIIGVLATFGNLLRLHASRWGITLIAFVGTFLADLYAHKTHYGPWWFEAFVTALGAAGLCLLISYSPLDKVIKNLNQDVFREMRHENS